MTDLARDLERAVGVPVLDGVACAVALAEGVARLGLRTSKRNTMRRRSPSTIRVPSLPSRREGEAAEVCAAVAIGNRAARDGNARHGKKNQ
jgi:hypothetical protein